MSDTQLKLFYSILESKPTWGKNELKMLILEIVSGLRTEV